MRQFASYNHFEKFALEHIIGQTFGKYSFGPQDMGQTLETALFGGLIPKGQPDLVITKDNEFLVRLKEEVNESEKRNKTGN